MYLVHNIDMKSKTTTPTALAGMMNELRKAGAQARRLARKQGFVKGTVVLRLQDDCRGLIYAYNNIVGGVVCSSRKPLIVDFGGTLQHCAIEEIRLPFAESPAATRTFSFSVPGIPIPYLRMTQDQVWLMRVPDQKLDKGQQTLKRAIRRYLSYKDLCREQAAGLGFSRYPLAKVYLNVMVFFDRKNHADPENIRKGLQDAIYDNDRMVAGLVDFDYDFDNPRCEVEIVEPQPIPRSLLADFGSLICSRPAALE